MSNFLYIIYIYKEDIRPRPKASKMSVLGINVESHDRGLQGI